MALTLTAAGTGTLPKSGPGVVSSVTVTETRFSAGDVVVVSPNAKVEDAKGMFIPYYDSGSDGASITVKTREQLPETLEFTYSIFTAT